MVRDAGQRRRTSFKIETVSSKSSGILPRSKLPCWKAASRGVLTVHEIGKFPIGDALYLGLRARRAREGQQSLIVNSVLIPIKMMPDMQRGAVACIVRSEVAQVSFNRLRTKMVDIVGVR